MQEKDLTSIAYSQEYLEYRNEKISTVILPENKISEIVTEENGYNREIIKYKKDGYSFTTNKVYNKAGMQIHEYITLYQNNFFCTPMHHRNGKVYLFYKEGLYGYSVFDVESKEVFNYMPRKSFLGGETFIATDIYYNSATDMIATEGCYWACPYDTFLFEIKNPMKQFSRYLNFHNLLDNDYEKYDDICFSAWNDDGIELKCYNVEIKPCRNEIIKIYEADYMNKLNSLTGK